MKNEESQNIRRNIQTIYPPYIIQSSSIFFTCSYKFNFSSFPNRIILQTRKKKKRSSNPPIPPPNPGPRKSKNSPRIIQLAIRHTIREGDPSSRPDSPSRLNSSCGNAGTRKNVRAPIENLVTLLAGDSYIFWNGMHGMIRNVCIGSRKRKIVDNYAWPSSIFRSDRRRINQRERLERRA